MTQTGTARPIGQCAAELEALRVAWNDGKAAPEIVAMFAQQFGRKITVSSVRGLVYRNRAKLGLEDRKSGKGRRAGKAPRPTPKQKLEAIVAPPPPPPPPPVPVVVHDAPPIPFPELNDRRCKWAVTERLPHMFCGGPSVEGSAYCEGHRVASVSHMSAATLRRKPVSMKVALS